MASFVGRMIFCGLVTMPVVKVALWLYGYRGRGIAKRSRAAKLMKKQLGVIDPGSSYALAQSIGQAGYGDVRGLLIFSCGCSLYILAWLMYNYPAFMLCLALIVISGLAIKYVVSSLSSRALQLSCIEV